MTRLGCGLLLVADALYCHLVSSWYIWRMQRSLDKGMDNKATDLYQCGNRIYKRTQARIKAYEKRFNIEV